MQRLIIGTFKSFVFVFILYMRQRGEEDGKREEGRGCREGPVTGGVNERLTLDLNMMRSRR